LLSSTSTKISRTQKFFTQCFFQKVSRLEAAQFSFLFIFILAPQGNGQNRTAFNNPRMYSRIASDCSVEGGVDKGKDVCGVSFGRLGRLGRLVLVMAVV